MSELRLITSPTIYLVGSQEVNFHELETFLADNGSPDWTSDAPSEGERLVEVAGRGCYNSFKAPRPGGNAAYLTHIMEAGHGCYDAETDVLTSDGWIPWPIVTKDHRLATRRQDGAIEYSQPVNLIRTHYRGRMYRVDSQCVDLLVTPNHNMLVCPTTTRAGRKKEDYRLIRADELDSRSHAYVKTGDWLTGRTDANRWITPDAMAFLGFAIGDGNHTGRARCVRFRLRRPRKIAWLTSLCHRLGWPLQLDKIDKFTVTVASEWVEFLCQIYDERGEKRIPQWLLMNCSPEQLRGLFLGLMESDGHRGRTGDTYDTTSDQLVGQVQQLCLHLGLAANVCYRIEEDRRISGGSFGIKPLTRLSVITRCLRPEVNKYAGAEGRTSWIEDWEGDVYCAEVPNHTLYVRRGGRPVWCGNSVVEHAVYNFIITGVSRSLTHELIRHRAGMSYSQLSQRFVDESNVAFVVPPALLAHKDEFELTEDAVSDDILTYMAWKKACEDSLITYTRIVDNLICRDFFAGRDVEKTTARKKAREAARSVLPNCTETRIFVTGNARALRNVFEQRGVMGADAEIRRLAVEWCKDMKMMAPHLFGDFAVETDAATGSEYLTFEYKKV